MIEASGRGERGPVQLVNGRRGLPRTQRRLSCGIPPSVGGRRIGPGGRPSLCRYHKRKGAPGPAQPRPPWGGAAGRVTLLGSFSGARPAARKGDAHRTEVRSGTGRTTPAHEVSDVNAYPIKKGQTLPLRIERLAFGGKGVARVEGYAVFVEGGLPGQEVLATVVKRKRAYAEARIEREIAPAPNQVAPRCEHFGVCGGCALQHLGYEAQLEAKRDHVRDALVRLGGFPEGAPAVEDALPSPDPFEYRNKMEFSFSPTRWLMSRRAGRRGRRSRPVRVGPPRAPAVRPGGEREPLPPASGNRPRRSSAGCATPRAGAAFPPTPPAPTPGSGVSWFSGTASTPGSAWRT